ncbi:MAG: NADH-quinone oxidoreductase subunit M [Methanobacteriota archaeon]|nr:MAG: NADH-quinone oxidoreductase subunit M [Euryarchaeota archaeon]
MENMAWAPSVGINYILGVDGISYPLVLLTTFISPIAMAASWHIKDRTNVHYVLLLLIEAALLGVFMALDLFLFFVFWEIVLVPMYFLIGIWGNQDDPARREYSAIKFFIYTHFAGLFVLLAIIALYFSTGAQTFSMERMAEMAQTLPHSLQVAIFGALLFGFAVKLPVWPFHTWLPDAHVDAPTAGSIHLASLLLKMGGYGIIRIGLVMVPDGARAWVPVMLLLGGVSAFYAAFCAMSQKDVKKLIAYSSVSHMGLALLGIAAFNVIGIKGAIYEMVAHGIITGHMFFIAGSIHHKLGTRIIEKITGFGKKTPMLMTSIAIAFLASMGLPGLAGFVAEFLIFLGVFKAYSFVAIIVVFSIIFTAGYFLWTLQRLGFREPVETVPEHVEDLEFWPELVPYLLLIFLAILFGIYPSPLLYMMDASVRHVVMILGG